MGSGNSDSDWRQQWVAATATAMMTPLIAAAAMVAEMAEEIMAVTVAATATAAACGSNNCSAAAAMTAVMKALNEDADFVCCFYEVVSHLEMKIKSSCEIVAHGVLTCFSHHVLQGLLQKY